jgi:hypothetical protein
MGSAIAKNGAAMTVVVVFAILGLLFLAMIIYLAKGSIVRTKDLGLLSSELRPVDVGAFCNLISGSEQEYLRQHLPPHEFRTIHRERMGAAVEYVHWAAANAAILIQLAEAARRQQDESVKQAGEKLMESALRLRLYALQLVPRLYLSMMIPAISPETAALADTYDNMGRQVTILSCLEFPTHGMASALRS